jgi:hypothetical protein
MDIDVKTPRQLALSMGNLCFGVTTSAALASSIYDSLVSREKIYFSSIEFIPHLSALCAAFNSFHEVIDLAHGDLGVHINTVGTLPRGRRCWFLPI